MQKIKNKYIFYIFTAVVITAVLTISACMIFGTNYNVSHESEPVSASTITTQGEYCSMEPIPYIYSSNTYTTYQRPARGVVYVTYDNTYIDSIKASAPYVFLAGSVFYPNYIWSGNITVKMKDGYDYIKSFTAKFAWSINYNGSSSYTSDYGSRYRSGISSESEALSQANTNISNNSYTTSTTYYPGEDDIYYSINNLNTYQVYSYPSSSSTYYVVGVLQVTVSSSNVVAKKYNLYFDYNNGIGTAEQTQVYYNTTVSSLPTPTRDMYTFAGWKIGSTTFTTSTKYTWLLDQVAVAQWTFNGYTLTASVPGGGGYVVDAKPQYAQNERATVTAVPYIGYKFSKWTLNGNDVATNPINFNLTQNTTLVATFVADSSLTASIAEGSATIAKTSENGTTTLLVTPASGDVYQLAINNVIIPIEYYKGSIWNAGGACEITYYTKEEPAIFVLKLTDLMATTDIKFYVGSRGELKNPPTATGGVEIDGLAIFSQDGGEARVSGYNTEDKSGNVHLSAVAYSGYTFVAWVASDGTDLSMYGASADIPFSVLEGKIITAQFSPTGASNVNNDTNTPSDVL